MSNIIFESCSKFSLLHVRDFLWILVEILFEICSGFWTDPEQDFVLNLFRILSEYCLVFSSILYKSCSELSQNPAHGSFRNMLSILSKCISGFSTNRLRIMLSGSGFCPNHTLDSSQLHIRNLSKSCSVFFSRFCSVFQPNTVRYSKKIWSVFSLNFRQDSV